MITSLFFSFREGFEAVLIIGIMLTYMTKTNKQKLSKFIYLGAAAGMLISVIGGLIGFNEAKQMEEAGEELFNALMMLAASGLILYFVVWMANQNRNISENIIKNVEKTTTGFGLFTLALLSVFREGIELVTLIISKTGSSSRDIAAGTVLGILLAIISGYIIFKTSVKLNIKIIFKVLGIVIIFVGSELFGEGLAKLVPSFSELMEQGGSVLYLAVSMSYFLYDDIKLLFAKRG